MTHAYFRVATFGLAALFCVRVHAQGTFLLTNTVDSSTQSFTNSLGTAVLTNGMIVFEGQLDSTGTVAAASDGFGHQLASVQVWVQTKLFDELPASNEVGSVQGAVAALRNEPSSSNGTYYVWGSTNNMMTWIPLMQTNNTPFAVTQGATNYVTFVFNYWGTSNTYQVFIGETVNLQAPSVPVNSLTASTGINGLSLLGSGALKTFGTASGVPGPLSAAIGFSVYATAKGVLLIVDTIDEKGAGAITVYALINGVWTPVGSVIPDGSNHYEFYASGALVVGRSYSFRVQDELGHPFTLAGQIEVKAIKMESVMLEPETLTVTFNTEKMRSYRVVVAESPSSAVWTPSDVWYPTANGPVLSNTPFTANDTTTTVQIPIDIGASPKRFFKIIMTNE
jgi:hypothetical protein